MLEGLVGCVIGVDTHKNTHTAAVIAAGTGAVLETITIAADVDGYETVFEVADALGGPTGRAWSIEGTGSYGAGLCSFLQARGELVFELDRPSRPARRDGAKDDALDAVRAARELLARDRCAVPRGGHRDAMRILLATRRARVQGSNPGDQSAQSGRGHRTRTAPRAAPGTQRQDLDQPMRTTTP